MKDAMGELNLTVITIIMIGAILAFFWVMWDNIKKKQKNSGKILQIQLINPINIKKKIVVLLLVMQIPITQ